MSRERKYSASVKKSGGNKWIAHLQYYSPEGKRMGVIRSADLKHETQEELEKLIKKHKAGVIHSRHKTFDDLAELKATKYGPAKYSESGKKLSGVRDPLKVASTIARLSETLGDKRLSSISLRDLEQYKSKRLESVKVATVNRELSLLRAMLNTAVRRKYMEVSPFVYAQPGELVDVEAEDSREVTISVAEEAALLRCCQTDSRRDLKALIITAVESGCRLGELLRLRWSDIDFASSTFNVVSYKGKQRNERPVPLTKRIRAELLNLRQKSPVSGFRKEGMNETLVFGISNNVKPSFANARREAGLEHLHFHDLRHTAATTLARSGMNIAHVAQILGHKNIKTTQRYINQTPEVIEAAHEAMEARK
jgi:integrase